MSWVSSDRGDKGVVSVPSMVVGGGGGWGSGVGDQRSDRSWQITAA